MTSTPVTISPDLVSGEALQIMNDRNIQCLFVCENDTPIGLVRILDLLKIVGSLMRGSPHGFSKTVQCVRFRIVPAPVSAVAQKIMIRSSRRTRRDDDACASPRLDNPAIYNP